MEVNSGCDTCGLRSLCHFWDGILYPQMGTITCVNLPPQPHTLLFHPHLLHPSPGDIFRSSFTLGFREFTTSAPASGTVLPSLIGTILLLDSQPFLAVYFQHSRPRWSLTAVAAFTVTCILLASYLFLPQTLRPSACRKSSPHSLWSELCF